MLYLRSNGYPKSRQQHDATIDKLETFHSNPVTPSLKVLLIRGISVIVYLLLGALIFRAIEYKNQDNTYWEREVIKEKELLYKLYNITFDRLEFFAELILKRRHEKIAEKKQWDYYQSLYFASTVTTTIGYGHITPQTPYGRLFLIVFALIGIPLNILALASVGEHITIGIFRFLRYLNNRYYYHSQIKHINIKVMFVSVVLMLVMLFLGGALYCSTEDWSYIDSIYYSFVAMATIGFGDLVPNRGRAPDTDSEKAIWFLRALYISIGLSLVSTVFTALSNAMEEINLILGRGKYASSWFPNKEKKENVSNQKNKKNYKLNRKEKASEKITYTHKIKKGGSYVMKYKVFEKLTRKNNRAISSTDWDCLFAEAKSKQTTYANGLQDMKSNKPTIAMLQTAYKGRRIQAELNDENNVLKLPFISDTDTSSVTVSASEKSTPTNILNDNSQTRCKQECKNACKLNIDLTRDVEGECRGENDGYNYYLPNSDLHKFMTQRNDDINQSSISVNDYYDIRLNQC